MVILDISRPEFIAKKPQRGGVVRKYLIIILLVICLAALAQAQDDTLSVLFIGNSHTYFNDMPQIFADLSQSGGRVVIKDSSTPGGYTLQQHTTNQTTLNKIAQGGWDYVVLQENSMYPVIEYLRYNSMYPAARFLDSLIIHYSGNTVFFLSWGWRYGGHFEIDGHESPVFENYFEMQDSMTSAYTEIADELEAVIAPVGEAWRTAVTWDTSLVLWYTDNYHPAFNGSYLAACVFYGTFFDESPVGLPYTGGLDPAEALFLQQAAWEILTDIDDEFASLPESITLHQNYPNPFNSTTVIRYDLPRAADIVLIIYDILGREVRRLIDSHKDAGIKHIIWDGCDNQGREAGSGVYFYKLQADDIAISKKMIYIR